MKTHRLFSILTVIALFLTMVMPAAAYTLTEYPYTPSGDMAPDVWDPGSSKWVNGNVQADYAEGQTTANVVTLVPPVGPYTIDLCLQVYDGPQKDKFAFVAFDRWDTTVDVSAIPYWPATNTPLPEGDISYDSADLVGIYGGTIDYVEGPTYAGFGCGDGYLGLRVQYTKTATTAYIVYGGVLAYPGADNPDDANLDALTVPLGKSASTINGTFQTRIVGTGDKTINYSAGAILPAPDVQVSKACVGTVAGNQYYTIRVWNSGGSIARGTKIVDALPADVVLDSPFSTSFTSVLHTSATTSTSFSESCWSVDGGFECMLPIDLAPRAASGYPYWDIEVQIATGGYSSLNTVTVELTDNGTHESDTSNNETSTICTAPSAVDLISFTAVGGESSVALTWETAQEIDNVGFNLFRAESADGAKVKLNGEIIPAAAMGSVMGATYAFTDSAVSKGVTYFYWLEDVETTGALTLHGPASARLVEAAAAPAPAPVFVRPVRELPVIELPGLQQPLVQQPLVSQPVLLEPVLQMPLIVTPGPAGPVFTPAPVLPAPIVRPPMTGLPVEGSLQ